MAYPRPTPRLPREPGRVKATAARDGAAHRAPADLSTPTSAMPWARLGVPGVDAPGVRSSTSARPGTQRARATAARRLQRRAAHGSSRPTPPCSPPWRGAPERRWSKGTRGSFMAACGYQRLSGLTHPSPAKRCCSLGPGGACMRLHRWPPRHLRSEPELTTHPPPVRAGVPGWRTSTAHVVQQRKRHQSRRARRAQTRVPASPGAAAFLLREYCLRPLRRSGSTICNHRVRLIMRLKLTDYKAAARQGRAHRQIQRPPRP